MQTATRTDGVDVSTLRGFLGIDASVANGYVSLRRKVRKLHERVLATSPNFFNITKAIPVNSELTIA